MTSPIIARGAIALYSLVFLVITVIAAITPKENHIVIAIVLGAISMGLGVIASMEGASQS
jgi:hypothetical protein